MTHYLSNPIAPASFRSVVARLILLLALFLMCGLVSCAQSEKVNRDITQDNTANDADAAEDLDATDTGDTSDSTDPCSNCPQGFECCNDVCVDTAGDTRHCGACNQLCNPAGSQTAACIDGSCTVVTCQDGFADCDSSAANGCEANIDFGLETCGACNTPCDGARCEAGQCIDDGCAAGMADCNNQSADGCETDLLTSAQTCGSCNNVCPDGETCVDGICQCGATGTCGALGYCFNGVCAPLPTFIQEPPCSDLGTAHPGGGDGDFLTRYIVTGRPGAVVQKWNEHVSCGTAPAEGPESQGGMLVLDENGRLERSNGNIAIDCPDLAFYGTYDTWAIVDGIETEHSQVTYFNSLCPEVETCALAQNFCGQ